MRILGFSPYHMTEACFSGPVHMKILEEAVIAQHNRFSGIKRYERVDFDKWLSDYDVRGLSQYSSNPQLSNDFEMVANRIAVLH